MSKAQVPKWMFWTGVAGVIVGIILFIVASEQKDSSSSSSAASSSSSSSSSSGGGGGSSDNNKNALNGGGAVLFIAGLGFLVAPFFLNKYFVTLTLSRPKMPASFYTWLYPRLEETLTFRTKER